MTLLGESKVNCSCLECCAVDSVRMWVGQVGLPEIQWSKFIIPAPITTDSEQTSHWHSLYLDASTFVSLRFEAARATGWTLMAAPFPNEPLPPNCSLAAWKQLSSVTFSFPETRQNGLQNNWLLRAYIANIQEIEHLQSISGIISHTKDCHKMNGHLLLNF